MSARSPWDTERPLVWGWDWRGLRGKVGAWVRRWRHRCEMPLVGGEDGWRFGGAVPPRLAIDAVGRVRVWPSREAAVAAAVALGVDMDGEAR